mmetsp:Transcript_76745/g.115477  ORF Transcript_76745/g.115477 Transcript_76745/m.115477 type:complete len:154 (+) Transcript_76745:66-527(+)
MQIRSALFCCMLASTCLADRNGMQLELHTESEDNVGRKLRKHVNVILDNTENCEGSCIVALQGYFREGSSCGGEELHKVTSPKKTAEVKFYDMPLCNTYRARVVAITDIGTAECTAMRRREREETTPKPQQGAVPDCGKISSKDFQVLRVELQ